MVFVVHTSKSKKAISHDATGTIQYPLIGIFYLLYLYIVFFRVARDFHSAELRARKHCPDEGDCRGPESGIHVPRQVQS